MKANNLIPALVVLFTTVVFGQEISQSQVPSVIVNDFQKKYPKAHDIEQEIEGNQYKVEFETGLLGTDHEIWYDISGKWIRHEEEISKSDLPKQVLAKIETEYRNYTIDDVKKITAPTSVNYLVELDSSFSEDWKVLFSNNGNILEKRMD